MKISVVVSTYNNWPAISRVVPALLQETAGRSDVEVVVVDSSTDGTAERVAREFPGARVIHPPNRILPGPARNLGAEKSTGDLLIFLDGDCVVQPGWLAGFEKAAAESELEKTIICGAVDLDEPADVTQFVEYIFWKLPESSRVRRGPYPFVITENMLVSRASFARTGGFGDSDSANDAQMDVSRRHAGLEIRFEPAAAVRHIHGSGARYHLRKLYRVGQEQFELMRTLPDYKMGRAMAFTFPVVFLARWTRISMRIASLRPDWIGRFAAAQPFLWAGLLAHQAGLWRGLFRWGGDHLVKQ